MKKRTVITTEQHEVWVIRPDSGSADTDPASKGDDSSANLWIAPFRDAQIGGSVDQHPDQSDERDKS